MPCCARAASVKLHDAWGIECLFSEHSSARQGLLWRNDMKLITCNVSSLNIRLRRRSDRDSCVPLAIRSILSLSVPQPRKGSVGNAL